MPGDADGAGRDRRDRIGFALLGAGIAWNVGTAGPTATAIGTEFDLSLVWLVPYLTEDVALSAGAAGVLAATMYVTVGVLRPKGGRLEAGGAPIASAANGFGHQQSQWAWTSSTSAGPAAGAAAVRQ